MGADSRPVGIIVDDDEEFVHSVRFVLDKLGVDLVATLDPLDFLAQIEILDLSFCLIDLNIGESNKGFELITSVRSRLGGKIPVLMLSATSDMAAITHAIEIGASDYILKPVKRASLSSKLSAYVNTPELAESRGSLTPVKYERGKSLLEFEAELLGVDELGAVLLSQNLIAKGTAVQISGTIVEEITGEKGTQFVTVVDTSMKPGAGYVAYCEFGAKAEKAAGEIRKWLEKKSVESPARG